MLTNYVCKKGHVGNPYTDPKGRTVCATCRYEYNKVRIPFNNFGGNRERAIKRDNESCVHCGMTRSTHRELYGKDITVDHINGRGHEVPKAEKDNRMENLQTLCIGCHARKTVKEQRSWISKKLTPVQVVNIRHLKGLSSVTVANAYGITPRYVRNIWHEQKMSKEYVDRHLEFAHV